MRLTILRLATAYGEEDPGNCARLLEAIDRRRFVWIGSGKNRKSLIHREDVAEAAVTALGRSSPGICIVNVSGPPVSMREIATTMAAGLGRELPGFRIPSSVALTAASLAWLIFLGHGAGGRGLSTLRKWLSDDHVSTDRAGSELQFKARIGLAEGIRREVEWYQSRKGCLAGS
jgi:nucleoside-diphosphate-sugar epimerase